MPRARSPRQDLLPLPEAVQKLGAMGPWLRGMAIFLAAYSTATARAQEEQPRTHPPDQAARQQKAPAADQELVRLRKELADLKAQLDQQRADQAAAGQRQQQQIEALRQQAEAVAARGRAIEENRRARIQWWNQAGKLWPTRTSS
ncbi:MAG: hypothetical protein QM765_08815 [Myxococcales bacterium]